MKRFLPKTLTSQTILVLMTGLTVSHLFSMLIYSSDKLDSLAVMGGRNMAERVVNITHLVTVSPIEWRERIVTAVNEPTFRVRLSPESMLVKTEDDSQSIERIKQYLRTELGSTPEQSIHIQFMEIQHEDNMFEMMKSDQWIHKRMMRWMRGFATHQSLRVSLKLEDNQWLNFATDIPEVGSFWSNKSILSLFSMALAVVLLSIWAVQRMTVPLRSFGQAAKRLGRDVNAPALIMDGPLEVREAAEAFNEMQEQLKRMIENRTNMLAAISHDLRTPITLLRLRTELIDDLEERSKMLSTLDDMENMIASTLEFARQNARKEDRRKTDLRALIQVICDDMSDSGYDVVFAESNSIHYECRPIALKRALTNLIDNAIKYAGNAQVSITTIHKGLEIIIEDNGPGIDKNQFDRVFQPFYRCEDSRNRTTGGVGLGMSIAQSVIHAHGGKISLENKARGGLKVKLWMPL